MGDERQANGMQAYLAAPHLREHRTTRAQHVRRDVRHGDRALQRRAEAATRDHASPVAVARYERGTFADCRFSVRLQTDAPAFHTDREFVRDNISAGKTGGARATHTPR